MLLWINDENTEPGKVRIFSEFFISDLKLFQLLKTLLHKIAIIIIPKSESFQELSKFVRVSLMYTVRTINDVLEDRYPFCQIDILLPKKISIWPKRYLSDKKDVIDAPHSIFFLFSVLCSLQILIENHLTL